MTRKPIPRRVRMSLGLKLQHGLDALVDYKREHGLRKAICHCKPGNRQTVFWYAEK